MQLDSSKLASEMAATDSGLQLKTRRILLKSYHNCFLGSEAVDWIVAQTGTPRDQAIVVGNSLVRLGFIQHVSDVGKALIDGNTPYVFTDKIERKRSQLFKKDAIPQTPQGVAKVMSDEINGVEVRDRKYHLRTYKQCFIASSAVDWMLTNLSLRTRNDATEIAQNLVDVGYIEHVCDPQPFKDTYLFFRFTDVVASLPLPPTEAPIVSEDDFEHIRAIGEGGCGKVALVRKKDNGKLYALKSVYKVQFQSEKAIEHITSEKTVLINDCPFLLHMYYSFQNSAKLFMVTDYLPGGDMFSHLTRTPKCRFKTSIAQFFSAELTLALEHLHGCGVVYRDLKLENILLDETGHICLADFGISKVLGDSERTHTFCGSQGYLAPEILLGESYSYAVDWFSLGVILYEMICGANPFLGANFHETCVNVLNKKVEYPGIFSKEAVKLISKLLEKDPTKRMCTAAEVKRQSWFKNINWNALIVKRVKPPFTVANVDKSNKDSNFQMEIVFDDSEDSSEGSSEFADFDYSVPFV